MRDDDVRDLSRREFIARAGASGGAALLPLHGAAAVPQPSPTGSIHFESLSWLARAIRRKAISSEEAVRALLARIEAVNPQLHAVVQLAGDRALALAREADTALARGRMRGPLHGVPVTIKDSLDTAGIISTAGTRGRAAFVPVEDATVVARLRAAGAIVLGKTNTPELTLSYDTDNPVYGRTYNPWDLTRSPGGSSGGAAAIIAAGGSPLDIGSDTGGSIRLPAHFCGIAGIKPTSGRVPRTGHTPGPGGAMDPLTQLGPLARSVEDLILALPLIAGPDGRDPAIVPVPLRDPRSVRLETLRVAFHTDNGIRTPDAAAVEVVKRAAAALADSGVKVEEARPQGIEETLQIHDALWKHSGPWVEGMLQAAGTREPNEEMRKWIAQMRANHNQDTRAELSNALERWSRFRSTMLRFLDVYDVILCPVNARAALPVSEMVRARTAIYTYTITFNLTGWPAAVVRAGTSHEGLPIGVQVAAGPWREDIALAVAERLEVLLGGFKAPSL